MSLYSASRSGRRSLSPAAAVVGESATAFFEVLVAAELGVFFFATVEFAVSGPIFVFIVYVASLFDAGDNLQKDPCAERGLHLCPPGLPNPPHPINQVLKKLANELLRRFVRELAF